MKVYKRTFMTEVVQPLALSLSVICWPIAVFYVAKNPQILEPTPLTRAEMDAREIQDCMWHEAQQRSTNQTKIYWPPHF